MNTKHLPLAICLYALTFSTSLFALDAGKVQAVIREGLEAKHLTLKSISCPVDADYEEGKTITCQGRDDEENQSAFTVKIGSKRVEWSSEKEVVNLAEIGKILSKKLSGKLKKNVFVTCENKAVFRKENCAVGCNVTVDDESRWLKVTSCPDKNGDMKYKIE